MKTFRILLLFAWYNHMNRKWCTDGNEKRQLHLPRLQLVALSMGYKKTRDFSGCKVSVRIDTPYSYIHLMYSLLATLEILLLGECLQCFR
jgi:hypothetical protein